MKIEFQAAGTAEEVHTKVAEESKSASAQAADADEKAGVEGVFDAISTLLTTVDGSRQATVTAQAEVRGAELTRVYLDLTIVPSGAVQEARADADRANVRVPEQPSGAAASTPAEEEEDQ
jgi:hypothetical protein